MRVYMSYVRLSGQHTSSTYNKCKLQLLFWEEAIDKLDIECEFKLSFIILHNHWGGNGYIHWLHFEIYYPNIQNIETVPSKVVILIKFLCNLLFSIAIKEDKIAQIEGTKTGHSCSCYFPELLLSLRSELDS